MTESLAEVAFLNLVAPGGAAGHVRHAANKAIEKTKELQQKPEVVERVKQLRSVAFEVWGDETSAVDFLFRRHPMLQDARPIDAILESSEGARPVNEILGRLRYGSAA
jgi:putative toxin-antitoxin system antitoxin component (TIGR02293 family)